MKCSEIQYDLPDFLLGKLSEEQQASIREHLVTCERCRSEAEQLKGVFSELHAHQPWAPPSTYWSTLLPKIHQRIEEKSSPALPEWITRLAMPLSAAIVAVVVLISLNPFETGTQSHELQTILQQLQPEEIGKVIEMQEASGISEFSSLLEESLTNGNGSLAELVTDETQLYSIPDVDIESVARELDEEEISDLVARLEQRKMIN
ncbi:MAG: zf-HC2 domain-containing protein [Ignavibacteriae bacterium]|nr:zf-HC2 domain-containing protein [Ignavibacteriota bacterium]